MNDQTIQQGLDVAKGIGDYGMMAISAAFMLVFAAVILIAGISILKKFFHILVVLPAKQAFSPEFRQTSPTRLQ